MNIAQLVNYALKPLGMRLGRLNAQWWRLDIDQVYEEKTKPQPVKYLNIGSAEFYHPYWHNLDMPSDTYSVRQKHGGIDFPHDLTKHVPLTIKDNTLEIAYTSHTIEHIANSDTMYLFKDVYRILKPGGVFRITCPDIDLYHMAYLRGDTNFFERNVSYNETTLEEKYLNAFATQCVQGHPSNSKKITAQQFKEMLSANTVTEVYNQIMNNVDMKIQSQYPQNHCNWYNYEKIESMLKEAGFKTVWRSALGQSTSPKLRNIHLFDGLYPDISLYVECAK